jgi:hypothetical protein
VWYCIAVLLLLFVWKAVIQRAFSFDSLPTYVVGIDRSDGLWAANIIPGYIVLVLGSLQLAEYDRAGQGGVTASDVFFETYGPVFKRIRLLILRCRAMYVRGIVWSAATTRACCRRMFVEGCMCAWIGYGLAGDGW